MAASVLQGALIQQSARLRSLDSSHERILTPPCAYLNEKAAFSSFLCPSLVRKSLCFVDKFSESFSNSLSRTGSSLICTNLLSMGGSGSVLKEEKTAALQQKEQDVAGVKRQMLSVRPYAPPEWASALEPVPQNIICLGNFPTPIHRWNLPGLPAGTQVFIKRDDLTGMQLSGNKVRKLEFLLAAAKKEGADCVITIGGIQSNHCRATAVAARYAGLDTFLILRTNKTLVDQDPGLVGNLLVERMVGAHISLVSKEEYMLHGSVKLGEILESKLRAEGRRPYVIPVGGSNSLGSWGYVEAIRELELQFQNGETDGALRFDDIVMACGSGGTTAGLALASHLSSIKAKVHAYGVCDDPDYFYDYVQNLLDGFHAGLSSRDILTMVNAKGSGYAISTAEELELVRSIAAATGIVLDPVYSGKALKGMLEDMARAPTEWEGRRVLFIHTGGLLGMYDKLSQLQPMITNWDRLQIPSDL